jgi:TonB family protein
MKLNKTNLIMVFVASAIAMQATSAASSALDTRVTMVVGFPGTGDSTASVLVVPGTVIPVSRSHRRQVNVDEESAEQAQELQELADKLQRGVGLDSVEVAYSEVYGLEVDRPKSVTGPRASSDIRGELTLLDFNSDLAVFRVVFRQGTQVLADSKLAVERGGRAVVGGLDGDEAPYFFLVLQPASKALFVKGDIQAPRKIKAPRPLYTEVARKDRLQGSVVLEALINQEGVVADIEVLKSLPLGLTEAATEAVRQWTFEPATLEGEPVAVFYNLTINFKLQEKPLKEGDRTN